MYVCMAILSKEGDVVRKCSMTPWNGHLNKNNAESRALF